jgi:hypothetical protein
MAQVASALADVELAFRHFEFAIKLMCHCELDHLDRGRFDADATLRFEKENVSFPSNTFETLDSVVSAAQANVGVCFGVTAIVLDAAFEIAGIRPHPRSLAPRDELRTLVYMVRCAFAHNPAKPCWEVHNDYARCLSLSLGAKSVALNLASLHDTLFEFEHIGGLASWFEIRRKSERVINGA